MQDETISITCYQLALMSAVVARVKDNESHTWSGDMAFGEMELALQADISVYDIGTRGSKTRHVRFDFDGGSIELPVCPQPELAQNDNRPDGDDTPPGTPIAIAA